MKKTLRSPENWQDFETLCKKLFGEMWQCPYTIKKNGRLGQPQSGVDIYGKPKGESFYFGIQCKGKDNYINSKLTKKEIDEEIKKARTFEPKLKIYVFATTAPKDSEIEKYIRIKDQESLGRNEFEIILYSWEDLVDLIEENKTTFNWYVNNLQFKEQFDVTVNAKSIDGTNAISPKFKKTITYFKQAPIEDELTKILNSQLYRSNIMMFPHLLPENMVTSPFFGPQKKNHAWCKINISICNTGNKVLEDWKLWLNFSSEEIKNIDDDFTSNIFLIKEAAKYRTTWAYDEELEILYKPLNNSPLIQKDCKVFECYCIPKYDIKKLNINWRLLARDYDKSGTIEFLVNPTYHIVENTEYVDDEDLVGEEIEISDYITIN